MVQRWFAGGEAWRGGAARARGGAGAAGGSPSAWRLGPLHCRARPARVTGAVTRPHRPLPTDFVAPASTCTAAPRLLSGWIAGWSRHVKVTVRTSEGYFSREQLRSPGVAVICPLNCATVTAVRRRRRGPGRSEAWREPPPLPSPFPMRVHLSLVAHCK